MSSDTIYRVRTIYSVETDGARRGISSISDSWGMTALKLNSVLEIGRKAIDLFKGIGGSVIDASSSMEKMRLSMAGMMMAGEAPGATTIVQALQMSDALVTKMLADAAKLPGTFEELQNITQRLMLPGLQSGKSVAGTEGLGAQAMAVGKAFGLDAGTIGSEAAMLLEGRAHQQNALWSKLKGVIGATAQEFNAMTNAQRFDALSKSLGKFQPMIDEYGKTWDAVSSTTESYGGILLRAVGAGVFGGLKGGLADLNSWFEKNQASVVAFASSLGSTLAGALRFVMDGIGSMIGFVSEFWGSIKSLGGIVVDVFGSIGFLLQGVGAIAMAVWRPVIALFDELVLRIKEMKQLFEEFFSVLMTNEVGLNIGKKLGLISGKATLKDFQSVAGFEHIAAVGQGGGPKSKVGPMFGVEDEDPLAKMMRLLDTSGKVRSGNTINNNNIRIEQTINDADNPDRVMMYTKKALHDALNHPVEDSHNASAGIIRASL